MSSSPPSPPEQTDTQTQKEINPDSRTLRAREGSRGCQPGSSEGEIPATCRTDCAPVVQGPLPPAQTEASVLPKLPLPPVPAHPCPPGGGASPELVPASSRFTMEPFCPLLLAGFSLRLAKAFTVNESTPADSNWTSTTSGKCPLPPSRLPPDPHPTAAPQPGAHRALQGPAWLKGRRAGWCEG